MSKQPPESVPPEKESTSPWFLESPAPVRKAARAGDLCPVCQQGVVDYDGMLNLVCPYCGYREGGCYT